MGRTFNNVCPKLSELSHANPHYPDPYHTAPSSSLPYRTLPNPPRFHLARGWDPRGMVRRASELAPQYLSRLHNNMRILNIWSGFHRTANVCLKGAGSRVRRKPNLASRTQPPPVQTKPTPPCLTSANPIQPSPPQPKPNLPSNGSPFARSPFLRSPPPPGTASMWRCEIEFTRKLLVPARESPLGLDGPMFLAK
jgi:hypothetical protein